MAFTGTANVIPLNPAGTNEVVILGLSLAKAASGTIGLNGDGGAGVQLPAGFTGAADAQLAAAGALATTPLSAAATYAAAIDARVQPVATTAAAPPSIFLSKGGTPFRITITEDNVAASGALEIRVRYPYSASR